MSWECWVKNEGVVDKTTTKEITELKYSKKELISNEKYANRRDILNVLLKDLLLSHPIIKLEIRYKPLNLHGQFLSP